MHAHPGSPSHAPADHAHDREALNQLRADYPDWVIQHMPPANLPWEARRKPFRMPPRGGFTWLNAATPDHLRELIGGALQIEAQAAAEDPR